MRIAIPIISTDRREFKEFGYFMRPGLRNPMGRGLTRTTLCTAQ